MKSFLLSILFFISLSVRAEDFVCRIQSHDRGSENFFEAKLIEEGIEVKAFGQFAQTFGGEKYEFSRPFLTQSSGAKEVVYLEGMEHESLSFEIVFPRFKDRHFKAQMNFIHIDHGPVSSINLYCFQK